jgi:formylglycine-generating enzyme required for sulfatase activity
MGLGFTFLARASDSAPQPQLSGRRLFAVEPISKKATRMLVGVALWANVSAFGAASTAPAAGEKWTVPELSLNMVPVPAGTFTIGSPANERGRDEGEGPQTVVTISKPFWLGVTEVTQPQWQAIMGNNPSQFVMDNNPVERISWTEATEFCQKLTERERTAGRLPAGYVYALPTEAQWEYACRAGTTGQYSGKLDDVSWYFKNTEGLTTKPVGQKQPNAWGLQDMHGNVWEWCADWYGAYPGGKISDPKGPATGTIRIVRGGGWGDTALDCRSAFRRAFKPDLHGNSVGLRLALVPAP